MNKLIVLLLFIFLTKDLKAQFINLQLNIEPELSVEVDRELDFGTIIANSGENVIPLGDLNMGVFNIKAIYTQSVYIELDVPESLINTRSQSNSEIPIELNISYNNSGNDDPFSSETLALNQGFLPIANNVTQERNNIWQNLYLYIFGSINVGEVENGEYSAEIILQIDYQ